MLRENLKREIDRLSEPQLQEMNDLLAIVKSQTQPLKNETPFWQSATPTERARDFRAWVDRLPKTGTSLPDNACDRDSIYIGYV